MSFAPDLNILLYASDASSPHHQKARALLDERMRGDDIIYLAWPVLMGYLRVATHASVFDSPLSPEEAMANVEALLRLPHVRVLSEGDEFWEEYRKLATAVPVRGNLVPDAHLAALLRAHGVRKIWTHDRDFRKFDSPKVVDPFGGGG